MAAIEVPQKYLFVFLVANRLSRLVMIYRDAIGVAIINKLIRSEQYRA